jgi:hypothetical protein
MSEPIKLGTVNGNQPEARQVDLFDRQFTLRRVTRSVQIELEKTQATLTRLINDDDATGDALVECFASAVDALLAPDGHRTSAQKIIVEKWNADEITLPEVRGFADQLQEDAASDRPS